MSQLALLIANAKWFARETFGKDNDANNRMDFVA
jgi:hypothetical protein